jgi:hypothetical protein
VTDALNLLQELGQLHEHVRVAFVGPSACRDVLANRFRTMKSSALRPWVMLNYARLLHCVHQVRSGLGEQRVWPFPSVEEVQHAADAAIDSLLQNARNIDDMRVERYVMDKLSDVGAVRSGVGAEDSEHQDGKPAEEAAADEHGVGGVIVSRSLVADGAGAGGYSPLDALLAIEKVTTKASSATETMPQVRVSRSDVPLNDYQQNGMMLSGAFWWLFLLQVHTPHNVTRRNSALATAHTPQPAPAKSGSAVHGCRHRGCQVGHWMAAQLSTCCSNMTA